MKYSSKRFHSRKCIWKYHLWNGRHFVSASICWYVTQGQDELTHYSDVIMSMTSSQIISLTIAYSTVYSGADERKHKKSVSMGSQQWLVNSLHKGPVTWTIPKLERRKTLGHLRSMNRNMIIHFANQSQTCQLLKIIKNFFFQTFHEKKLWKVVQSIPCWTDQSGTKPNLVAKILATKIGTLWA